MVPGWVPFKIVSDSPDLHSRWLLNVISNWAKKWAIQFNPQKTKNIVFSRRDREHPPVYFGLNGDEIDETDNQSSWNNISIISYMEKT